MNLLKRILLWDEQSPRVYCNPDISGPLLQVMPEPAVAAYEQSVRNERRLAAYRRRRALHTINEITHSYSTVPVSILDHVEGHGRLRAEVPALPVLPARLEEWA